jgi:hypothetical protein
MVFGVFDALDRICMLGQIQSPCIDFNLRCGIIPLPSVVHLRVSSIIPLVFWALTEPPLTLHSHGHHSMLVVSILALFLLFLTFPSVFSHLLVLGEDTLDLNKRLLPLQGIWKE